jgi:hypothetical protein
MVFVVLFRDNFINNWTDPPLRNFPEGPSLRDKTHFRLPFSGMAHAMLNRRQDTKW